MCIHKRLTFSPQMFSRSTQQSDEAGLIFMLELGPSSWPLFISPVKLWIRGIFADNAVLGHN